RVGTGRGHDHVERVLGRLLHEDLLTDGRSGHVLHDPLAVKRAPALDPLGVEVILLRGHVVGKSQFLNGERHSSSQRRNAAQRGFQQPAARYVHRALAASDAQSSFSDTVFHSEPFTSVTSATGWPSLRAGMTLTARNPEFSFTASPAAASSDFFALAIASLWDFAAVRSSPSVIGSALAAFPVLWC